MPAHSTSSSRPQRRRRPAFTSVVAANCLKVYIDGLPHLIVRLDELVAVQAWRAGSGWYCIELTLRRSRCAVLAEYDAQWKWLEVLKLLDAIQLFPPTNSHRDLV